MGKPVHFRVTSHQVSAGVHARYSSQGRVADTKPVRNKEQEIYAFWDIVAAGAENPPHLYFVHSFVE
jgi:hypothetical protein